jgi:hypothetical protein
MLHDQPTDKQARAEKIMTITRLHDDPHYPLVMPLLPVLYYICRDSGVLIELPNALVSDLYQNPIKPGSEKS